MSINGNVFGLTFDIDREVAIFVFVETLMSEGGWLNPPLVDGLGIVWCLLEDQRCYRAGEMRAKEGQCKVRMSITGE